MNKNYYEILGVNKDASTEDIKKSYRRLALLHHPDVNANKSEVEKKAIEEKMAKINEAYKVLGNVNEKRRYDSMRNGSFGNFSNYAEEDGDDIFSDVLKSFFGRGFENSRNSKDKVFKQNGEDISITIDLTFRESVIGTKKKLSIPLKRACSSCNQTGSNGSSSNGIVKCYNCKGTGLVNVFRRTFIGSIQTQDTCNVCKGLGNIIKNKCYDCKGNKILIKKTIVEISIPKGIKIEERIRYKEIGNDGINSSKKGDIYLNIRIKENSYFQRKENNIYVNLPISFLDAILGSEIEVFTLEEKRKILIPSGSQNGDTITIKKEGFYFDNTRGDMIFRLKIKLPNSITDKTKEILDELREKTNWNPTRDFLEKNKNKVYE